MGESLSGGMGGRSTLLVDVQERLMCLFVLISPSNAVNYCDNYCTNTPDTIKSLQRILLTSFIYHFHEFCAISAVRPHLINF